MNLVLTLADLVEYNTRQDRLNTAGGNFKTHGKQWNAIFKSKRSKL